MLIEKEFVSFGHQFAYRLGYHIEELDENNYSQVFVQFLDCVYQLLNQFDHKFEFNSNLLNFIAFHLYSGKYGTFLFNNEYDRIKYKAKFETVSIWTDILGRLKSYFINPFHIYRNKFMSSYLDKMNKKIENNQNYFEYEFKQNNDNKEISNSNTCEKQIIKVDSFYSSFYENETLSPDFSSRAIVLWEDLFLKYNIYYKKYRKINNISDEYYDSLSNTEKKIQKNNKLNINDLIEKEEEKSKKLKLAIISMLNTINKNKS